MIHWMAKQDMGAVLDIETRSNEYYDEDFDTVVARANAWQAPDFIELMREPGGAGRVVIDDLTGKIVAFLCYENMKDYVLIYKLVVDPDHRLKGHGTKLLDSVKKKLKSPNTKKEKLVMLVSDQDTGMHLFLQKQGFKVPVGDDGKPEVIRQTGPWNQAMDDLYSFEFEFEAKEGQNAA
jgi:GNAT superfamily N-acetyltransferase